MRKWELRTDLFENKVGDSFPECPQDHPFKGSVMLPIEEGCAFVDPKRYPQHFRLVEEQEFTESDMIEAMQKSWNLSPGQDVIPIIETIRKRKAGK